MEIHDLASPAIAAARGTVARVVAASLGLLLALGAAPARAQDAEETLDEGVAPRATVVGQAGYAWQGKADIDGGGSLQVNRFDVGLLGHFNLIHGLRSTNTFFFAINDYDFDSGRRGNVEPWGTILTMRLVPQLQSQLDDHWGLSGGGVFIFAPESGAN